MVSPFSWALLVSSTRCVPSGAACLHSLGIMIRIDYYPSRKVLFIPFVGVAFVLLGVTLLMLLGRPVIWLSLMPLAGGAYMIFRHKRQWSQLGSPSLTLFSEHLCICLNESPIHVSYKSIRGISWDDARYGNLKISVELNDEFAEHEIDPLFLSAHMRDVFAAIVERIPMKPKHIGERGRLYAASFEGGASESRSRMQAQGVSFQARPDSVL